MAKNDPYATMLPDYPDVLSAAQVAKILHIGKTRTYQLLRSGEIPSIRIGNSYRIPRAQLISYLLTGSGIQPNPIRAER